MLAAVEDAPPVLTVLGRPELLVPPIVAVVGARNASANGRRLARELAAGLGEAGIVVASGMARGIDAAAHLGALDSGTVAVLAGGADIVYPEENRGLYDAMRTRGAILAELPLRAEPQARHFPRRNRIISGLALGRRRGRGRGQIGVADHGAICARTGAGGLRRTGLAARSALPRLQRPAAQWRDADRDRR